LTFILAAAGTLALFSERVSICFAMDRKFNPLPPDLVQMHPGLGILRMAALFAEGDGALDEEALDALFVACWPARRLLRCGQSWFGA
jgi:hypothetical protein